MTLWRRKLVLGALAGAAALGGVALGLHRPTAAPPKVGRLAPPFRLPRLQAPGTSQPPLDSRELLGHAWVLNAWASWCAPCREEHTVIMQLARTSGLRWVGLVHRDDPRAAGEWLHRLGNPYDANLLDADGRVGDALGLLGVPETFVIDRTGIVRLRHTGPMTAQLWQERVGPVLRQLEG